MVAPRYESGGEAQGLVRPARDRGLPWPKTCAAKDAVWILRDPARDDDDDVYYYND